MAMFKPPRIILGLAVLVLLVLQANSARGDGLFEAIEKYAGDVETRIGSLASSMMSDDPQEPEAAADLPEVSAAPAASPHSKCEATVEELRKNFTELKNEHAAMMETVSRLIKQVQFHEHSLEHIAYYAHRRMQERGGQKGAGSYHHGPHSHGGNASEGDDHHREHHHGSASEHAHTNETAEEHEAHHHDEHHTADHKEKHCGHHGETHHGAHHSEHLIHEEHDADHTHGNETATNEAQPCEESHHEDHHHGSHGHSGADHDDHHEEHHKGSSAHHDHYHAHKHPGHSHADHGHNSTEEAEGHHHQLHHGIPAGQTHAHDHSHDNAMGRHQHHHLHYTPHRHHYLNILHSHLGAHFADHGHGHSHDHDHDHDHAHNQTEAPAEAKEEPKEVPDATVQPNVIAESSDQIMNQEPARDEENESLSSAINKQKNHHFHDSGHHRFHQDDDREREFLEWFRQVVKQFDPEHTHDSRRPSPHSHQYRIPKHRYSHEHSAPKSKGMEQINEESLKQMEASLDNGNDLEFATCEVHPNRHITLLLQQNVRGRINMWQRKDGGPVYMHVLLKGFRVANDNSLNRDTRETQLFPIHARQHGHTHGHNHEHGFHVRN